MTRRMAAVLMIAACGDPAPASGPTMPLLLVANTPESTLSILGLPEGNELARLQTGIGPHEVAVSPDRRRGDLELRRQPGGWPFADGGRAGGADDRRPPTAACRLPTADRRPPTAD